MSIKQASIVELYAQHHAISIFLLRLSACDTANELQALFEDGIMTTAHTCGALKKTIGRMEAVAV